MENKKGFTLIEMLVVIGIIVIMMGASIAGYSKMTKTAERAKIQELVSNTATAMTAIFQETGRWPKKLANAGISGRLDKNNAFCLRKKMGLMTDEDDTELRGADACGIVTPVALAAIKRAGGSASEGTKIPGGTTVGDHILYFSVDTDGDGVVEASVGGETVRIRATAAVWCIGKSGGDKGKPWPYKKGLKKDDVYSWTYGQTRNVK